MKKKRDVFYIKGVSRKLHTGIYNFLVEHPALDAFQYLVSHIDNKELCRRMANRNGLVLQCHTLGDLNKDKNLYFIKFGEKDCGFFAQYRRLLKYLCVAERFHFIPVIEWDRSNPYTEDEPVNGSNNPFEYYFRQPTDINIEQCMKSYNVFFAEKVHLEESFLNIEILDGEQGYLLSEDYMRKLAEVSRKYIKLNDILSSEIEKEVNGIVNSRKTLGVHYRGSDYKSNYQGHPISIDINDYICAVKEMLAQEEYEQIFLATDDMQAVNLFCIAFEDKVKFYEDVTRTEGKISVAFLEKNRRYHHFLAGREVLRDMLTLARCDSLLAGVSQVSICAEITKYSHYQKYLQKRILFNGINRNLKYFDKPNEVE